MIDAEATEGVEYFPVKWLADQRRAISNHYKATLPNGAPFTDAQTDLADIYYGLYEIEEGIRELRKLPPIGAPPPWVSDVWNS